MAQITYGIWCKVSGGITGSRQAWLKKADGSHELFDTFEDAQAEARRLMAGKVDSTSTAAFLYRAQPYRR